MSARWDHTKILKLIHLYQENECLWNTKSVFYKNKTARDNAYKRMVQGMGDESMTTKYLENKIKSLRTIYIQEFRKVKEAKRLGISSHGVYKPKLSWYNEMDFIANYIEEKDMASPELVLPVSPTSTIETEPQSDPFQSVMDSCNNIYIKEEFIAEDESATNPSETQEVDSTPHIPNSSENECSETITDDLSGPPLKKKRIDTNSSVISQNPCNDSIMERNEFYYFGLSIAAQLKNMPWENALKMQADIQNLLTNERRQILKNSVQSNNHPEQDMESNEYILSSDKQKSVSVSSAYNNTENNLQTCDDEPSTSKNQKEKKHQLSFAEFNSPNNEILRLLHTVTENQLRMQEQVNAIHSLCERSRDRVMDKMIRQNLVISKVTFSSIKKLFGKSLSPIEEEMSSYFPLSCLNDVEELENKLKDKTKEDAVKTYLISKKGNQSLDSLFRSLITDEFLDAYNWDGRWGRNPLKELKFFGVVLNDVYCHLNKRDYETEIRKAIELSHNRAKQKKFKCQQNKQNKPMEILG